MGKVFKRIPTSPGCQDIASNMKKGSKRMPMWVYWCMHIKSGYDNMIMGEQLKNELCPEFT